MEFVIAMGIPTAITGLLVWWLKKYIDKRERTAEERERNIENLMTIVIKNSQATNVLAEATARAVQRIPDAHCNGDMTAALKLATKIQEEEKEFVLRQGIQHIFGD